MDRYNVSLVQRVPTQLTVPGFITVGPVIASGLMWSTELGREGAASVVCNPATLEENVINLFLDTLNDNDAVPGLELWIHRDSDLVHRGPIIGWTVSGTGEQWALRSAGPLYYLRYMYVLAATTHSGVDQFSIGSALINQWQDADWGHFGLDTSGIGLSGVSRTKEYSVGDAVFSSLVELAEAKNGFDVWVDLTNMSVNFGTKGSDKSNSVILDRRGISDAGMAVSLAAGDLASEGRAVNTDDAAPLSSVHTNTTLQGSFGKTGIVSALSDVVEQTFLDDHAQSLQEARTRPLIAPDARLIPVSGAGVLDFDTGDLIEFVPRIGIENVVLTRSVQRKEVTVSDDGSEEIGVALS